jgi:hypothetical protein
MRPGDIEGNGISEGTCEIIHQMINCGLLCQGEVREEVAVQ